MRRTVARFLPSRRTKCMFSTVSQGVGCRPSVTGGSLSEPLRGVEPSAIRSHFIEDKETKITTLSNGLRVASQDKFGSQCAMGGNFVLHSHILPYKVIVNSGPRYEVNRMSGISHYLEKLGFHVTFQLTSHLSVLREF